MRAVFRYDVGLSSISLVFVCIEIHTRALLKFVSILVMCLLFPYFVDQNVCSGLLHDDLKAAWYDFKNALSDMIFKVFFSRHVNFGKTSKLQ